MQEMNREAIHTLRKREHLAQAVFACYSNVSKSWPPTGSAAPASLAVRPCGPVPITNGGKPRSAGLHAGMGWMRDDFDAALPDSFWGDANLRLTGC